MAVIFHQMSREQLIIAAFFATPKNQRFMSDADRPDETPEQILSLMQCRPNVTLGDLSLEGLRAYAELHGSAREPQHIEDLRAKFSAACDEAIRNISNAVD